MSGLASSSNDFTSLPTDEELGRLQLTTLLYYLHEANPSNGLIRDKTAPGTPASIVAVGLALAALPVIVERGVLDREFAPQIALKRLQFFTESPQSMMIQRQIRFEGLISAGRLGPMPDVTHLIEAAQAGDRQAANQLLPLVYDELRKLAAMKMSSESPEHTFSATALVHEAYLRLVGDQQFDGRGHFFSAAAEAMRRILVESARRRNAEKRGGRAERVPLIGLEIPNPEPDEVLAVDEALDELSRADPQAAKLVSLRFFAGLSAVDAATALGMSTRSAHDLWAYSRAWLHRHIRTK